MKRAAIFALIFLAAGAAAATAAGRHSSAPSATRCGGQLWRLKTFSDRQRRLVELNSQQTTIAAIRDRLAQVIGNLLSNAIKYSPEGGQVRVSASLVGDEAWIWVRDEGLGIPAEHQQRIFTKFFRGDVGRERGISGTGLAGC